MKTLITLADRAAVRAAKAETKLARAEAKLLKAEAKLASRKAKVEAARQIHQAVMNEARQLGSVAGDSGE